MIAFLETKPVPLVIYRCGTGTDAFDGVSSADRHPLIAAYLAEHYEPATVMDDRVHIWRRKRAERGGAE